MHNRELNQFVKKHTRITARSKTIIDLVFSDLSKIEAITLQSPIISYHSLVEIRKHGLTLEKLFLTSNLKMFIKTYSSWS